MQRKDIWTYDAVAKLGTMTDSDVARNMGITPAAVGARRKKLNIAPFLKQYSLKSRGYWRDFWTASRLSELGKRSDSELAIEWGCAKKTIRDKRAMLGIAPFIEPATPWSEKEIELLGKATDHDVGKEIGRARSTVTAMRSNLGIPAFQRQHRQQDDYFYGWEKFALLPQGEIFDALKQHYKHIYQTNLTYPLLSKESFYSVSRLQKWFTAGSAQQPLNVEKRHHFWLLAMFWGLRSNG